MTDDMRRLADEMQSLGYIEFGDCLSLNDYNLILAALRSAGAARIERLEAALREIAEMPITPNTGASAAMAMRRIAALDNLCEDEGCPNAGTPHVCINRQENDDVFPGFRGNNEA